MDAKELMGMDLGANVTQILLRELCLQIMELNAHLRRVKTNTTPAPAQSANEQRRARDMASVSGEAGIPPKS